MAQKQPKAFNGRAFISTLTGLSFIGMCVTGIILFVVPPGRIANWTGWTIFGLTKRQWQGLHVWFSIVFMVAACVHTVFNWRCLLSYFKSKVSQARALRWEWVLSLVICTGVLFGTLADVGPFAHLMAWGDSIKHSWDDSGRRAPVAHAELLSLQELARHVDGLTTETIVANLRAHGITVDSPEQIVGDLAAAHGLTPDQLYRIATGQPQAGGGHGGGRGMGAGQHGAGGGGGRGLGRLTLTQYCEQAGIETESAIETLKQKGITATETTTLRDIAAAAGLHPSAVPDLLQ